MDEEDHMDEEEEKILNPEGGGAAESQGETPMTLLIRILFSLKDPQEGIYFLSQNPPLTSVSH